MYKVVKDGELQKDWENLTLSIEPAGTYKLPKNPYDTIWNPNGTSETIDEQSFLLNDSIFVNYWQNNDSLYLTKILLSTSIPCDIDDPEIGGCTLVITGQ